MQSRPNIIVPLTVDEKDFLLLVYRKRRRFLVTVYVGLIVVAICISPVGSEYRHWEVMKDAGYLYKFGILMRNIGLLVLMIIGSGVFFYFRTVLPYKRDADSGVKEKISYTITRKEYFPLTGQYYVAFDDPEYPHHQTDQDTWYNCYEGGYFFIYRAIRSKFVFEDNGRYTLM